MRRTFPACLTLAVLLAGCGGRAPLIKPAFTPPPPKDTIAAPAPAPAAPETAVVAPEAGTPPSPMPDLRVERNSVRVFLDKAAGNMALKLTGPFAVYSGERNLGTLQGPVKASAGQRSVVLDGREAPYPATLMPLTPASLFEFKDKRYRGALVFRLDSLSKPILVNEVTVEEYLKGVVPYEIGKREAVHFEALKVQAIAARTYTYSRLNLHRASGFDVYPDESDQVYNGTKSQFPLGDSAVDATRDEVITHADTLIQAYYYSTSPGRTSNIEEVWPDKGYRPYLRTVNDSQYCASSKYFDWKEEWSGAELERIVNKYGPETFTDYSPGRLQNIVVIERAACGRVKTTLFVVDGREYRALGDRVRWVLRRPEKGNPILRSAFVSLNLDRGFTGKISRVIAFGGGYGHGVGFSQIGALTMAERGMSAEAIVKFYYTGVEIRKVKY